MTKNEASTVNSLVESFLRHEVNKYQKKLKYQRKSYPPLKNSLYISKASVKIHTVMLDQEIQTQDTVPICNDEEEINCRVKKELVNLSRQLLEYNNSFIQEITKQLEERDSVNNKLCCEIEQQKLKLQDMEIKLASLKLKSTY
jgi:hypothetical protein